MDDDQPPITLRDFLPEKLNGFIDGVVKSVGEASDKKTKITNQIKNLFQKPAPEEEPELSRDEINRIYCLAANDILQMCEIYNSINSNPSSFTDREVNEIFNARMSSLTNETYTYLNSRPMLGPSKGKKYCFWAACILSEMRRRMNGPNKTFSRLFVYSDPGFLGIGETDEKKYVVEMIDVASRGWSCNS